MHNIKCELINDNFSGEYCTNYIGLLEIIMELWIVILWYIEYYVELIVA